MMDFAYKERCRDVLLGVRADPDANSTKPVHRPLNVFLSESFTAGLVFYISPTQ